MKIVVFTDMTIKGSGYKNIAVPLMEGLVERGHEIKVLGLQYSQPHNPTPEHRFPFSIIPSDMNQKLIFGQVNGLVKLWDFDLFLCIMDIPVQKAVYEALNQIEERRFKFAAVTAVEADPLLMTWAASLSQLDHVFVISEFGTEQCVERGVDAVYLPVGIDTESWRLPTPDERSQIRTAYGLAEDTFAILTVADNQERKFLSRTAQIIRDFKHRNEGIDIRWILNSRLESQLGWWLNDLTLDMDLVVEYFPVDRGISFKDLWSFYAASDVFLLTSKAEGLCMPAIEAMAVGVPVVATDCTGLAESMRKGGGYPIGVEQHEDDFIDPFGNGRRYFASIKSGVQQLQNVYDKQNVDVVTRKARAYTETLLWENAVNIVDIHIKGEVV